MLPYLKVQLAYALSSAVAVVVLERVLARSAYLRERPRVRALTVLGVLALPLTAWLVAVRAIDGEHSTYQFASIAMGFYIATMWLPLTALFRVVRERRRDLLLVGASVAAIAIGQYALWIEPNRLVTSTYTLAFPQWPADAAPLRLVHISDLQTVGECEREHRAAALINSMHPDLIVVTGDYVAGPFFDPEPGIAAARKFFLALERPRYGIVCVPGHSEAERIRLRVFDGLGVRYLCNEEFELELDGDRRLRLFGARTLNMGFDISRLATRNEDGLVTLVATHEPEASWELEGRAIDLHLAGHTHGGQVALPWYGAPFTLSPLPREFARGLRVFGDHLIHVNPGIGMEGNHAPRIRFLCPPEIDLLLLQGGGSARPPEPVPLRP